jgi:hypothetical protein
MKTCKSYVFGFIALAVLTFVATGNCFAAPDLSQWVDSWFKITHTAKGYHYDDIDVGPSPKRQIRERSPGYMKITGWDDVNEILLATVYIRVGGAWSPANFLDLEINYFAGDALDFIGQSATPVENLVLHFKGKLNNQGAFVMKGRTSVKSLGGIYLEIDDVPGSTERWAGSAAVSGKMIPVSKVPAVLIP